MRQDFLALLAVLAGLAGAALRAEPAASNLQAYSVVVQRNIFDRTRTAPLRHTGDGTVRAEVAAAPRPVTESFALAGVALLEGTYTAVFRGNPASLAGSRQVGEAVGDWRVAAVDLEGATLVNGSEVRRLAVGVGLSHAPNEAWQVAETLPAETAAPGPGSAPAAAATSSAVAGKPAADSNDVLKRMLQRRQQELNR